MGKGAILFLFTVIFLVGCEGGLSSFTEEIITDDDCEYLQAAVAWGIDPEVEVGTSCKISCGTTHELDYLRWKCNKDGKIVCVCS